MKITETNIKSLYTNTSPKINIKPQNIPSMRNLTTFKGLEILGEENRVLISTPKTRNNEIQRAIAEFKKQATEICQYKIHKNGEEITLEAYKGTKRGSNEGFFAYDKRGEKLFYVKLGEKQSKSEVFASKLYKLTGANVAEMELFTDENGKTGLLSEYIPNLTPIKTGNKLANTDFGADVWLANWDAVCSSNLQTDGEKGYRLDYGGALEYRALGAKKTFGYFPTEITTLINPEINNRSARIFATMTREDVINSFEKVINCKNEDIEYITKKYCSENQEEMYNTLIKRKEIMSKFLNVIKKTPQDDLTLFEYLFGVQKIVFESINI